VSRDDETLLQSDQLGDELRALRDDLWVAPTPQVATAHLAAMDRAITELAVTGPDTAAGSDVVVRHSAPTRRRRMRALAVPVAATVGVLGLTCGLAAAGGLPGPAQRQAARVAGAVGWSIPDQSGSSSPSRSNPPDPGGHRNLATTTSTTHAVHRQPASVPPGSRGADGSDSASGSSGRTPQTTKPTGPPAATAPGQSSPGKSGAAPGPGSTGSTPADPGKSGDAPGHSGSTPGASSSAPGRSGTAPEKSGEAPGHTKDQGDG
jgi:hypothetical protein